MTWRPRQPVRTAPRPVARCASPHRPFAL